MNEKKFNSERNRDKTHFEDEIGRKKDFMYMQRERV